MVPAFPFTYVTWHRICVVGSKGKKHSVDPDIDRAKMELFSNAIAQYIEALHVIAVRYDEAESKNLATASSR